MGRAFTLIEILLAVGIFGIVLVAINTVFFSAVRLRDATSESLDRSLPLDHAMAAIRRDLLAAVPPGGGFEAFFRCGPLDTGFNQSAGLEFYTASGILREDVPWSDIRWVRYYLRPSPDATARVRGHDLVRGASGNLLALVYAEPEEQWLAGGIEQLEIHCFDGSEWRDSWDTDLSDTALPVAVRFRFLPAIEGIEDNRTRLPRELVVPLTVQPRDSPSEDAEESL
jgi:prepilin-type N-terminal cleavage/methylation domain-containing protein